MFSKCHIILLLLIFITIINLNSFSKPILVQKVYVNGELVEKLQDTINLKTSDNISILLSRIPDTLSYKYQCKGIDSVFMIQRSPLINYINLPKGDLLLRVSTSNRSATELNNQSPLVFTIDSSFLESWSFIIMLVGYIVLLLGGASYFIILSNYRSKLKLFDLRNDWTNKLHNDIGADLSSVGLYLDTLDRRLEKLDPSLKRKVEKAYTILNAIQSKLRFVFDLVDPKKNSLQVILSEIELFAIENFALKKIEFNFENKLKAERDSQLNIGQINKIYLIIKEAINNIVKHSNASNAYMKITRIREGVLILIGDDGLGFDPKLQYRGNGIDNLKEYGREGFIDVQINSSPNKGTEIKVLVPKL